MSYTAATTLPPSGRCWVNGAYLDGLVIVTGLAPYVANELASGTLRKSSMRTPMRRRWRLRCAHHIRGLARPVRFGPRETGSHERLDWKGEEPLSNMHDGRATTAPLALKIYWTTMFSDRPFNGKLINLLEPESLISLLRRVTREGIPSTAALGTCDSRVVSGAVSKKDDRGHEKSISCSENCGSGASPMILHWIAYGWPPGPADAPSENTPINSWYASLSRLPHPPTVVFASEEALAEMNLLREPLSTAAHTACEHVRTLESSGILNRSGAGTLHGEDDGSRACVGAEFVAPPDMPRLSPDEPCLWHHCQTACETNCRAGDIERRPRPELAFIVRTRRLGAGRQVKDIHGVEELLDHGLRELGSPLCAISSTLLCVRDPWTRTSLAKPVRAVPPEGNMPPCQPLELAEVLAKAGSSSGRTRKRELTRGGIRIGPGCGVFRNGVRRSSQQQRFRRERAPATGRVMSKCSALCAPVTTTLEWSLRRTRHHRVHFRTLRRVIVMIAGNLDEGRIGGFQQQHAILCQTYSDPDPQPDVHWSPAEAGCHRLAQGSSRPGVCKETACDTSLPRQRPSSRTSSPPPKTTYKSKFVPL